MDREEFQFWKMELNVMISHKRRKMKDSLSSASVEPGDQADTEMSLNIANL